MFNSQEILDLLESSPKGYLDPCNAFFSESNFNLFRPFKKLGAISNRENEIPDASKSGFKNHIFCNAFGCSASFDSTAAYQSHYKATHRFICGECKKSFPTDHFLDLHISENHDSYFLARLERGELLFKCYLEECQDVFGSSHERKEHCLKHHKFPSNFRFDQMSQKKNNLSKMKSEQCQMDVDGESHSVNNKSHNFGNISFGKQEKTFCLRDKPIKIYAGETLDNMNTLKQVLDTI